MLETKKLKFTVILLILFFGISGLVFAGAGGTGGSSGSAGTSGGAGTNNLNAGGGGGGGGSAAGGNGTNGAGGTVVIKNTTSTMTISGTVDARGGGSSTTNGGTVKLLYTGSAPSTSGVTTGRTYSAAATSQQSAVCQPTLATDNSAVGTITWSNTSNSLNQDGSYATAAVGTSHYLVLTGCDLTIPSSATITGVRADFLKFSGSGTATDNAVRLVKAGSIQTTDRSANTWNSATARWDTYGSATDLWGATLTPSDVSAGNFGVAISTIVSSSSLADIDASHITVYFTVAGNTAPAAPTLIAPSSGATGQAASPTFQFRTTDADNDYLRYKIIIYNSDCSTNPQTFDQTSSQTGWTGQDQQTSTAYTGNSILSSSTIANFNGASLSAATLYCWKAAAIDPGGTNGFGSFTSTQLFTTAANTTPAAPTLVAPTSGATGTSTSPLLQLRTTDADNDYLRYKILLYNSDCSTGLQTFDQTVSQVGWSGQDQQTSTAYTGNSILTASTIATYGAASLSVNTQYCWKGAAIDPAGTNSFSSFSSTQLFTTGSATGQVQLNGGTQINGGTLLR